MVVGLFFGLLWPISFLPKNKTLRGVFITHQHSDHYSGLQYLRGEGYAIEYRILLGV